MNTDTSPNRLEFIPILILLGGFALILILLLNNPTPSPRINVQNANQLSEVLRVDSGEVGNTPRQFALSPDAKQLVVTNGYRNELWQLNNQTEQVADRYQTDGYSPMVFFRDGTATAAFIDLEQNLTFLDMSSRATLQRFEQLSIGADWDLTPDGKWLASTRDQLTLNLTNIETGEQRLSIPAPDGYHFQYTNTAFSEDGKLLAASLPHGEPMSYDLFLWDAVTGALIKKLGPFSAEGGLVSRQAFSHDGQRLAVGGTIYRNQSLIGYIQLWDIPSGRVLATWTGNTASSANQIAFTSDDQHLMLEGSGRVWLWDINEFINDGVPLIAQKSNRSTLRYQTVALNPDGSLMANDKGNGEIDLYEVKTGRLLNTLKGDHITNLVFSADGRLLVASDNRYIHFWSVGGYNPYLPPMQTLSPNMLPTFASTPAPPR